MQGPNVSGTVLSTVRMLASLIRAGHLFQGEGDPRRRERFVQRRGGHIDRSLEGRERSQR